MFKKLSFRVTSLIVALVLALGSAVTVFAITITVDGTRESAWDGSGGQTPGAQTDPNEGTVNDDVDIARVQWTNDTSNMYYLFEVQAPPVSTNTNTWQLICLDTDNNSSTGSDATSKYYDNCNNQVGFDRFIHRYNYRGTWLVDVEDETGTYISGGDGTQGSGTVLEISAPVSVLFGGSCVGEMRTVFYFDGASTAADDNTPDSGVMTTNCGSPTAITLDSMHAASGALSLPLALAGAAFVLIAGAGLVLRKRNLA